MQTAESAAAVALETGIFICASYPATRFCLPSNNVMLYQRLALSRGTEFDCLRQPVLDSNLISSRCRPQKWRAYQVANVWAL
jgi:hypothetical protein